ncbi:MAG TPA: NAD(P)-binding protein, partial [Gaiellaceae bacterium]|nr:NAD(P)-binding protein [Gaiellaceae bacterium]
MARAVVIGSGPNGLAGALTLARAGVEVEVHEAAPELGGGARTGELTLPGFRHDLCSAIHPLGRASPFFRWAGLEPEWVDPPAIVTHPLDDGTSVVLERDLADLDLGSDTRAYRRLLGPIVEEWERVEAVALGPLPPSPRAVLRAAR